MPNLFAPQLAQEVGDKAQNCCRLLEEEGEELSRLHKEHAAEAKAKRQQQLERERMVCSCLTVSSLPTGNVCISMFPVVVPFKESMYLGGSPNLVAV